MIKVNIKPLSVNEAWQGKRFKTKKYLMYEKNVLLLLPKFAPKFDRYEVIITLGISNINQDIDNPLKPILDIMQKKYGFNDRQIYKIEVTKEIVKKGNEYFKIVLKEFKNNT
jgi:Holliday junction resolvase RusA-like endonuclease